VVGEVVVNEGKVVRPSQPIASVLWTGRGADTIASAACGLSWVTRCGQEKGNTNGSSYQDGLGRRAGVGRESSAGS
jgi:hypothetical protein